MRLCNAVVLNNTKIEELIISMINMFVQGVGTYEDCRVESRLGQIQSQGLRHDGEVEEKVKLERRMRQLQNSKPKTPSKILPPRSPMRFKSPAQDRLGLSSMKQVVGADFTFLTPRSR